MTEPEIDRLYQRRRQQTGRGIRANDLLDAAELLPGMDPTQARNTPGQHVAVVRVVCQPAGDAAHYGGASLEQPLANAVRRADAWMAPRSSWGRPALLSELDATGWKADGVEGWVSGMVHHDYPILLRGPTAAAVMRYPALLLSQVTVPLRRAGESDGFIDYSCAYEGLVVNEAVAALVLAGEWAADLQPAGIVHVVLQLAGFADAVPYYASKARAGMPVERMPRAPHGIVSSVNVPSLSLRQTPVDVARILLDRWLAAFYRGHDLYENIIGP